MSMPVNYMDMGRDRDGKREREGGEKGRGEERKREREKVSLIPRPSHVFSVCKKNQKAWSIW